MTDKIDRRSIEHAHLRIDYLERDFQVMNDNLKKLVELQEKASRHNHAVKWMLVGSISFYVLETIGFIEALKIAV